jgi:hypothetical protein
MNLSFVPQARERHNIVLAATNRTLQRLQTTTCGPAYTGPLGASLIL